MATVTQQVKICDKCKSEADTKLYRIGFHRKDRRMDLCQACAGPMVELLSVKMPMNPRALHVTDLAEVG